MNKIEHWQKIIDDAKASGLTQKIFCQNNNIKIHTLHYWLKKLSERPDDGGQFIPFSEIKDISNLQFKLEKNGNEVQNGNTSHMIFNCSAILAHISQYFTLNKGDLIFTGTPEGVGSIQVGDVLKAYLGEREILRTRIL